MNPNDKQNSEDMSHMGIYLLTVALETAADHLPKYASLMSLVKNELCFNLFRVGETSTLLYIVVYNKIHENSSL